MIRKSNISKGKLSSFNRIQKNLEAVKNKLRAENIKAKDTKKSEQVTPQEKIVYEDTTKPKKKASIKEIKDQEEKLYDESIEKAGVDYSQIKEPKNAKLIKAQKAKNDEFYTRLYDVENELRHYSEHFKDKVVLCNCDDPTFSAFWKYFHMHFGVLGLKKLIGTHYETEKPNSYAVIYKGGNDDNTDFYTKYEDLKGNGDFRSNECIDYLKECDIVVTNPPFSLFKEFIGVMSKYKKDFLVVGNKNAVTYSSIFELLKDGRVRLGYGGLTTLTGSDGAERKDAGLSRWFTTLQVKRRKEDLILTKIYSETDYPKYDNYDAINVDKVKDIPINYDGVMGVPISFIDKYNPDQFEIVGCSYKNFSDGIRIDGRSFVNPIIEGRNVYKRLFIRRKYSN